MTSAENGNDNFYGVCGYCQKKNTSTRIFHNTKLSNLDLSLGLERKVAYVARMDTLLLNVGKSTLIKLQNGTRV